MSSRWQGIASSLTPCIASIKKRTMSRPPSVNLTKVFGQTLCFGFRLAFEEHVFCGYAGWLAGAMRGRLGAILDQLITPSLMSSRTPIVIPSEAEGSETYIRELRPSSSNPARTFKTVGNLAYQPCDVRFLKQAAILSPTCGQT